MGLSKEVLKAELERERWLAIAEAKLRYGKLMERLLLDQRAQLAYTRNSGWGGWGLGKSLLVMININIRRIRYIRVLYRHPMAKRQRVCPQFPGWELYSRRAAPLLG